MSNTTLVRTFSSQSVNILRISQGDGTNMASILAKRVNSLMFPSAILISLFGTGVSMFAVSQLQSEGSPASLTKK